MYQKIIIVGNLGRDPEMRYLQDGTAVTSFSVATSSKWTDKASGQPKEETTWFRVSVFGRQAEAVNQYMTKGQKVLVEGRIRPDPNTGNPRLWTRQDGTVAASFEIHADTVRFLGTKGDGGYEAGAPAGGAAAHDEDDIPF